MSRSLARLRTALERLDERALGRYIPAPDRFLRALYLVLLLLAALGVLLRVAVALR